MEDKIIQLRKMSILQNHSIFFLKIQQELKQSQLFCLSCHGIIWCFISFIHSISLYRYPVSGEHGDRYTLQIPFRERLTDPAVSSLGVYFTRRELHGQIHILPGTAHIRWQMMVRVEGLNRLIDSGVYCKEKVVWIWEKSVVCLNVSEVSILREMICCT